MATWVSGCVGGLCGLRFGSMVPDQYFNGGAITESRRFRVKPTTRAMPQETAPLALPEELAELSQVTPARLFTGRTGGSYRTETHLQLKAAHAAARDAVRAELDPLRDWGSEFIARWDILAADSLAKTKAEYLLRPETGRSLSDCARRQIRKSCQAGVDVQFVLGDGLSPTALSVQVPRLLPELIDMCGERGWTTGRPICVRYCRVGIINDIGETLGCKVVALLIGERPGWATSESLSVYFGYQPRGGDTDSRRNLISNIHERGVTPAVAIPRIADLIEQFLTRKTSGIEIKERTSTGSPRIGN